MGGEARAVRLALVREVDARGVARSDGATSTQVWLRNRLLISTGTASRLVRLGAAVDAAPAAVGEAVAAGKVNLEQAQAITRAVDRFPRDAGAATGRRSRSTSTSTSLHRNSGPARWTTELA